MCIQTGESALNFFGLSSGSSCFSQQTSQRLVDPRPDPHPNRSLCFWHEDVTRLHSHCRFIAAQLSSSAVSQWVSLPTSRFLSTSLGVARLADLLFLG